MLDRNGSLTTDGMAVPRIKAEAARVNATVLAILWLVLDLELVASGWHALRKASERVTLKINWNEALVVCKAVITN